MSRDVGAAALVGRCAGVWLAISLVVAVSWTFAMPGVATLVRTRGEGAAFDELLIQVCAAGLVAASGWLWLVATTTIVAALTGRVAHLPATAVRRGVLVLCGAALTAGMASPAMAADATGGVLDGLSLPDRASVPSASLRDVLHGRTGAPRPAVSTPAASRRDDAVRVAAGDSLWTIAHAHPRAGTSPADRWQEIWRHNRAVIGEDPDLILPGQHLELPHTDDGAPALDPTTEGPR